MRSTFHQLPTLATVLAGVLLLAGCPSQPVSSGPTGPTRPGKPTNTTAKVRAPAPVEGLKCQEQPCMFHPGTGEHHQCLNAAGGDCFQYGRRCMPASACVQDDREVYRKCLDAENGSCNKFGDPCEPAGACAFDGNSRGYRQCTRWNAGTCASYGAPCTPTT